MSSFLATVFRSIAWLLTAKSIRYRSNKTVAKPLKLLVLWRSDEDAQQRLDMVKEFNELCHSHGLVSIIEPVVRPPRRGDKFDREQAIIDAAKELGDSGADLYKVEMPALWQRSATRASLCFTTSE